MKEDKAAVLELAVGGGLIIWGVIALYIILVILDPELGRLYPELSYWHRLLDLFLVYPKASPWNHSVLIFLIGSFCIVGILKALFSLGYPFYHFIVYGSVALSLAYYRYDGGKAVLIIALPMLVMLEVSHWWVYLRKKDSTLDFEAIGKLIGDLKEKNQESRNYNSAHKLKELTGEDFDTDYEKWQNWLEQKNKKIANISEIIKVQERDPPYKKSDLKIQSAEIDNVELHIANLKDRSKEVKIFSASQLRNMTGKDFGLNHKKWEDWWVHEKEESTFIRFTRNDN